jgi:hypothetical protein
LAPTADDDPLVPVEEDPEPSTKTVEVQTVSSYFDAIKEN